MAETSAAPPNENSPPLSLHYTPPSTIPALHTTAHHTPQTPPLLHNLNSRLAQLHGIERLLVENASALTTALSLDLGQSPMYSSLFELDGTLARLRHTIRHLKHWAKPTYKPTPFPLNLNPPVRSEVRPHPRGVALIITPWNFPIQLPIGNLVDALAAGNVCILKPSEKSFHVTKLLTELLTSGRYVDKRAVIVVNGGKEVAEELLKGRVDVISYTGGEEVGRLVAKAAAVNLTPVVSVESGERSIFSWNCIGGKVCIQFLFSFSHV